MVGDYRRVLDRNDIDAVLIGTPDFSHAKITADALAAGKHVFVEKPIANNIARINMMLDAYNKYPNLVVQVGTQQRSWDHFIEAKSKMDVARPRHPRPDPARRRLFAEQSRTSSRCRPGSTGTRGRSTRRRSRSSRATRRSAPGGSTGSGLVGDWGAHHIDVANWFMNADAKQPLKTTAVGFYSNPNTDPECVYSQFSIAWQFDNYIMSFANDVFPRPNFADPKAPDIEGWGVYFYGSNGTLQVNRMG